jgi:hypothetical protein
MSALGRNQFIRNGRSDVSRVTWGNWGEADVVVGLQGATGSAVLRGNGDGTFNVVSIWCTELRRNSCFCRDGSTPEVSRSVQLSVSLAQGPSALVDIHRVPRSFFSPSKRWGGGVTADPTSQMQWTKPELVVQIQLVEWTAETRLRHAKFPGLRQDKAPKEVSREP